MIILCSSIGGKKRSRPLNKTVINFFHMHDKGLISRLELGRGSITLPTIAVVAAATVLLLSPLFSFSQAAYSQLNNTNLGPQNLSSLLKSFMKPPTVISGHYSNPTFGITDIVFPEGWHGRELPPIVGLTVIMHPGNESGSILDIASSTQPHMILQVINNSELAGLSAAEGGNLGAFSISKICKPLAQNTTSNIDGKTFNVATVECPLSSLKGSGSGMPGTPSVGSNNQSSLGTNEGFGSSGIFNSLKLNPNAVMQAKLYELKGPEKTYRLVVFVSNFFNGSSTSQSSEKPDISKYTQLLDTTASTLKLR
jgi:hypothetical protein